MPDFLVNGTLLPDILYNSFGIENMPLVVLWANKPVMSFQKSISAILPEITSAIRLPRDLILQVLICRCIATVVEGISYTAVNSLGLPD